MDLRRQIYETAPHLAAIGQITAASADELNKISNAAIHVKPAPFETAIDDFYLTNPIARASAIMAEMSTLKREMSARETGTHG
jgi:NADH-quinone oxidoreductase subunit G